MGKYRNEVFRHLQANYAELAEVHRPAWLSTSRWDPALCVGLPDDTRLLAVDIIPSAALPVKLYKEEVLALLRKQPELRAAVCVLEEGLEERALDEGFEERPLIEKQCRRMGLGLFVLSPGLGLNTLVPVDFGPPPQTLPLPAETGWFPEAILNQATDLENILFADTVNDFVDKVRGLGDDEDRTWDLVCSTIDALLQQHPGFRGNVGQFMRLRHFERTLHAVSPEDSEHVFHSFRVFLTGCAVINQFHEDFLSASRFYTTDGAPDPCVEYSWLLASLFHDIGYLKQRAARLVSAELDDDDFEVEVRVKPTHWLHPHYQDARRVLGSVAAYVADPDCTDRWDGGTISDTAGDELASAWTHLYEDMSYHGVISAFDMLADLFQKAAAADERSNRPFIITHAVPAALSILLHDWHVWPSAKQWGLFPIDVAKLPLAALLIYIDTWDDYRRREGGPKICVRDFSVSGEGVSVVIQWERSEDYEKEKVKYGAWEQATVGGAFTMDIVPKIPGRT